jgi:gliding motility-associated-like protein
MKEVTFCDGRSYINRSMKLINNIALGIGRGMVLHLLILLSFIFIFQFNTQAQTYPIPDTSFKHFLITNYPLLLDSNSNLKISSANSQGGTLDCSNRNIKDLSGIQYFINIHYINCSNNQITYIPSLAGYADSLIEFNCSNNRLSALPVFNSGAVNLKSIKFNNNLCHTLPYFNQSVDTLHCQNNYLTFDDLLYGLQPRAYFIYAPQFPVQVAPAVESEESSTYTFFFPQDDTVSTNSYKVFKNGIFFLDLFQSDTFTLTNIKSSDAGFYTLQVVDSLLPALTLTTTPQELVVGNKNSKVFTPDGNNNNDSYLISCNGNSRIYNKYGNLVKEFQGTAYWDGTDFHGKPLPSGAYIIQCGDKSESSVTLIR